MWRWCLSNETAVLQLRVEGSRRGKRGQRNSEHLTHTWVEKLVEKSWYITRKGIKRRGTEKKERERESKMLKKYNSKKEEFSIFDHITRACLNILFVLVHAQLFPFNTIFQYLFPRFKLAFSPILYKFIVWAFCLSPFLFWVQVKTSPYRYIFICGVYSRVGSVG